jgi:hypothetical protein
MQISMRLSSTLAACAATMLVIAGAIGNAVALSLFSSESQAQQHCPNDSVVWLDFKKRIYYLPGQRQYARGRTAIFVCRGEAKKNGYRRSLLGLR